MRSPRNARRGFIYIVGWRVLSTRERNSLVHAKCPSCGVADARLNGRVRRAWFTMFFIPILPLDPAHRAQRISECRECGERFEMPIEQLARSAGAAASRNFADTIALYNDLRDHPQDGSIMLRLLKMYQELDEPAEAESAARHFPKAMAADPECAVVLEQMRREAAAVSASGRR